MKLNYLAVILCARSLAFAESDNHSDTSKTEELAPNIKSATQVDRKQFSKIPITMPAVNQAVIESNSVEFKFPPNNSNYVFILPGAQSFISQSELSKLNPLPKTFCRIDPKKLSAQNAPKMPANVEPKSFKVKPQSSVRSGNYGTGMYFELSTTVQGSDGKAYDGDITLNCAHTPKDKKFGHSGDDLAELTLNFGTLKIQQTDDK